MPEVTTAASRGDIDRLKKCVARGDDINEKDKYGWTALHSAAYCGQRDTAKYLIRAGADINIQDKDGCTALHEAVINSHRDIAEYLIRAGADIHTQNRFGRTALHFAVARGYRDIAEYLIREGADIHTQNSKGKTPVHLAKDDAMRELIRYAHAERRRQEEASAAAEVARRCASDVSVVHSKVLEVRSLRKPDLTSSGEKLMSFIADDDLRDSVMGLLSAFESKDSWLTAPCIEAVESVDGSDSVFAELERKLLSLQESIRSHVESKDVDMEYLQGLQGERDSVRRKLVSVMRTILAAPVEKWLEVLKQVYDGCRWSGNEVIKAVECTGGTRYISSTELMTLLSDFEDKVGEWVGECSRSPAEETERALAAFHKCLGCVGEMLVDENSMSMHNLEVCSKKLDECLRVERDHWLNPMLFYPDLRRDTREACVAVARFTSYWRHKASEIVQQRASIRSQLEEMEVWVDGPPKGEIFSGLLDDIRNAKIHIAECEHAIKIQDLKGDNCDRARQQQLEKDLNNARVELQFKRNALCKERATLSRIALTHFPEMPILLPGIGFDPKDLPDIAKGLLIIDRSIHDYSDLEIVESNSRNMVMRGCFAKRNVFLKAFSCSNEDQQKSFWREARILATHCQSPYIADITAVFLEKGKAYIEMPFYVNGNLALYLERQNHGLSILSKRLLCNDVLNGLAHLHGNNVVHCDVKPDNILISDRGTAMLTDFDISIDSLSRDQSTLGGKMRGSHDFMAPEIFIGNAPSYASDMYSFGVCVLHIFGLECNRGSMDTFLVHKIPKCDGELNDLRNRLREVLCQNPEERLSSRDALQKSFFAIQDLANDIQTLRERIVCQERETMQERERLEKEQQARMRVCCLCDEEVDMCQGLQCKGEARHFTCESCLNAYVKVEATSERGRRRLVHIWDISGQRDLYLRGNKGDILREFRQVANSTELQKPWPNMRAAEFNEVWEERTDYGGEFRIMCPYHSHGCNVGPFDSHKVVRLLTEEVHRLYQRSERELVAWRERCEYEEAQRLEKARLAALSEKDREIQTHGNYIRNCILSLRCPRCAWLFTPDSLDYDHCLALYCPNCNCGFCGYCLHDCGDDAHRHTANCRYNNRRPNVFSRRADYEESQRLRRTELLKAYLATIRVGIREEVINAVTEIISELGITI